LGLFRFSLYLHTTFSFIYIISGGLFSLRTYCSAPLRPLLVIVESPAG